MALVGHPKYAGGADTSRGDADFVELYATLERAGANALMAGDTHDFEYYVDYVPDIAGSRPVHHFVNGGGGAYLSIGGALSWPGAPPTQEWAFYPSPGSPTRQARFRNPALEVAGLGLDQAFR